MSCFGKFAGFFVVKQFSPVAEDLELPRRSGAQLYIDALLGGSFAQAHGRATQIKSKQATAYFDHASRLQIDFAATIVFT